MSSSHQHPSKFCTLEFSELPFQLSQVEAIPFLEAVGTMIGHKTGTPSIKAAAIGPLTGRIGWGPKLARSR